MTEYHKSYASLLLSQSSARCESLYLCVFVFYICVLLCVFVFCICFTWVIPSQYHQSYASLLLSQSSARWSLIFVFCICVYLCFVFVSFVETSPGVIPSQYHQSYASLLLSQSSARCESPFEQLNTAAVLLNKDHQYTASWLGRVTFWTFEFFNIWTFWKYWTFEHFEHWSSTAVPLKTIINTQFGQWHAYFTYFYMCVLWHLGNLAGGIQELKGRFEGACKLI